MKRLETQRVILRDFKIKDAKQAYENWASVGELAEVSDFKEHESMEETKQMIQMGMGQENEDWYTWAIELKETQEVIGFIRVYEESKKNKNCKIRWMLGYNWWNKGYTEEALKEVIKYTFEQKDINIIICDFMENIEYRVRKTLEQIGMTKEATLKQRRYDSKTGKFLNEIIYSITKQEYKEMTKN